MKKGQRRERYMAAKAKRVEFERLYWSPEAVARRAELNKLSEQETETVVRRLKRFSDRFKD